ncbi:S-adenosyl-L-methionine-dependent methyltransferase [Rhizoctonia solani]|nr:S-adenosyl-L-methionine-dependent methyltransferase [Rhizoctonia solani]
MASRVLQHLRPRSPSFSHTFQPIRTHYHSLQRGIHLVRAMSQSQADQPKGEGLSQADPRNAIFRVRALLAQCKSESREQEGWDAAWQEGATPWDAGMPQPPLRQVFETNIWSDIGIPKSGRALVPGCGRGYDAIYLASQGYSVVGADLSATAISEAQKYLSSQPGAENIQVEYQVLDYFKSSLLTEEPFDLVYDYTFFCAIPPELRVHWGRRMTEIIKPGGYLIALMYPIDPGRARNDGPPFPVDFEAYSAALNESWDNLLNVVPAESQPTHEGRERLGIWRRK